jgi:hypothetical protein
MSRTTSITRYNQRIPQMRAREFTRKLSGLRLGRLTSLLLAMAILRSSLSASSLGDTARALAHKISADAGPGSFSLEVTNRSSLDDKGVREVRSALEAELQIEGLHTAKTEQARSFSRRACAHMFGRRKFRLGRTRRKWLSSPCRDHRRECRLPPLCQSV